MAKQFNRSDHPRGQPGNPGQFKPKQKPSAPLPSEMHSLSADSDRPSADDEHEIPHADSADDALDEIQRGYCSCHMAGHCAYHFHHSRNWPADPDTSDEWRERYDAYRAAAMDLIDDPEELHCWADAYANAEENMPAV